MDFMGITLGKALKKNMGKIHALVMEM